MATKPLVYPNFAVSDLNNGTAGAPNVVEPSAGKKLSGWNEGERPPRETFNWLHRITNNWIEWFDQELGTGGLTGHFAELPALHSGLQFFCAEATFTLGSQSFNEVQTATTMADDNTNYVYYDHDTLDVEVTLGGFPGDKRQIPLFVVTTVAGAITNVVDVRSWATMPHVQASWLDDHEIRTAGYATTRVTLTASDTTPTPDCALGNLFYYSPTNAVNTMQLPINAEALSANQTQEITLLIENGAGETTSFATTNFQLLNSQPSQDGLSTILGEGFFKVQLSYNPDNNRWYGSIEGPGYNVVTPALRKVKLTTETKNTSGVTDDDTLTGFILPAGLYSVKGFLATGFTPGNGGIDLNWEEVGGTFGNDSVWVTSVRTGSGSPDTNEMGVFFITNGVDLTIPDNGLNDAAFIQIDGVLEVTASAEIDLQWAPVNNANCSLAAGSWIEFERLDG